MAQGGCGPELTLGILRIVLSTRTRSYPMPLNDNRNICYMCANLSVFIFPTHVRKKRHFHPAKSNLTPSPPQTLPASKWNQIRNMNDKQGKFIKGNNNAWYTKRSLRQTYGIISIVPSLVFVPAITLHCWAWVQFQAKWIWAKHLLLLIAPVQP